MTSALSCSRRLLGLGVLGLTPRCPCHFLGVTVQVESGSCVFKISRPGFFPGFVGLIIPDREQVQGDEF